VEALRAEVRALERDPFSLERAIREDLDLAKPGEVIVRFGSKTARGLGSNSRFP
jgi:cell division protein FtsB